MTDEKQREHILNCLGFISPADLDYTEWIGVGMALKAEGFEPDTWESWSASDSRHKDGECYAKWKTFQDSGITGATITEMAKERGWSPAPASFKARQNDRIIGWDEELSTDQIISADPLAPLYSQPADQLKAYLKTLFKEGDKINFVADAVWKEDQEKWTPGNRGFTYDYDYVMRQLEGGEIKNLLGDYNQQAGVWMRINPMDGKGVNNSNATAWRHVLVESDSMDLEKQIETYKLLELPIAALVLSGKKSVHAIVKVDAKDEEEYKKRVRKIFDECRAAGIDIDKQNKNCARLSRCPGVIRDGKEQSLIALNVGRPTYEEWESEHVLDQLPEFEDVFDFFENPPELPPESIRGVLRKGGKLVLTGPSKAGKSFALIELAQACATGTWWFGRFKCKQQRVLYINMELSQGEANNRILDTWNALAPKSRPDRNTFSVWNLRGEDVDTETLINTLIKRHSAAANPPDFYIIDPIYKVNAGDENSAQDMNKLLRQFDRLCKETGACLAYAHHHAKGSQLGKRALDRGSGSGVIGRDADASIDLDFLFVPHEVRKKKADETRDKAWLNPEEASGFRIETTFRSFASKAPFNLWFRYPVHVYDSDERFQALKGEGEKAPLEKASDSKTENKEANREAIRQVLNELLPADQPELSVRIGKVREMTGLGKTWLKELLDDIDEFEKDEKGFIRRV